jgi:hypothetical protein
VGSIQREAYVFDSSETGGTAKKSPPEEKPKKIHCFWFVGFIVSLERHKRRDTDGWMCSESLGQ